MTIDSDLPRALLTLAEAFDREAKASGQRAEEQDRARRNAAQTRLMAGIARLELRGLDAPDEVQLASARAWLTSGTDVVQVMQARRYARALPGTA
jgi:predicted deacetylase